MENDGQFGVVHEMWILDSRQMCKNKVTTKLATLLVCSRCRKMMEEMVDSIEMLCDESETENECCHLGDKLIASGGCEAAVIARVRIGWVTFRKNGELLLKHRLR